MPLITLRYAGAYARHAATPPLLLRQHRARHVAATALLSAAARPALILLPSFTLLRHTLTCHCRCRRYAIVSRYAYGAADKICQQRRLQIRYRQVAAAARRRHAAAYFCRRAHDAAERFH